MMTNQGPLRDMIIYQKKKLLEVARRIVPQAVEDDLWQPNDFPELEMHPLFRYEEGVLHGLLSADAFLSMQQKP
jgi:hypothetical protein